MKNKYKKFKKLKIYLKKNHLNLGIILVLAMICNSVSVSNQTENKNNNALSIQTHLKQQTVATTYYKASVLKDTIHRQTEVKKVLNAENMSDKEVKILQN